MSKKLENLNEYTLEEFRTVANEFKNGNEDHFEFKYMIIVPMGVPYDFWDNGSSYGCMAYIFVNADDEIVGVLNGGSDSLFINGSGYGWRGSYRKEPMVPSVTYGMDCLLKSGCVRIWCMPYNNNAFSGPNNMRVEHLNMSITEVYGY